jgi:hypothetical protein
MIGYDLSCSVLFCSSRLDRRLGDTRILLFFAHVFLALLFDVYFIALCKAVDFHLLPRYQKSIHPRWYYGVGKTGFSMERNSQTRYVHLQEWMIIVSLLNLGIMLCLFCYCQNTTV